MGHGDSRGHGSYRNVGKQWEPLVRSGKLLTGCFYLRVKDVLDNSVLIFGELIINNVQETGGLDKSNCHLRVVFPSTTVSTGRILFLDL